MPFSTDIKELFDLPSGAVKRFVQLTNNSSDLYALAARKIIRSGTDFTAKIEKLSTVEVPVLKEEPVSDADKETDSAPETPNIEVTKGGQSPE
jgi:hypothetical protein